MKNNMRIIYICILYIISSVYAYATTSSINENNSSEEDKNVSYQTYNISIVSLDFDNLGDNINILINVDNPTDDKIKIYFELLIPPNIVFNKRKQKYEYNYEINENSTNNLINFNVPEIAIKDIIFKELFYRIKPMDLIVTYKVIVPDIPKIKPTYGKLIKTINPKTSTTGVLLGSLIGVILINLFLLLNSLKNHCGNLNKLVNKLNKNFCNWLTEILVGCFAVIIFILLVRYTSFKLPDFPIIINVNDAIGGFALGIFYKQLASFLMKIHKQNIQNGNLQH